jgi:hypothetical protein
MGLAQVGVDAMAGAAASRISAGWPAVLALTLMRTRAV